VVSSIEIPLPAASADGDDLAGLTWQAQTFDQQVGTAK
jgi:hypothetical protein